MEINAIKCKKCGDIIFSRARHDFHSCSCESIYIDGGFDYCRMAGAPTNIESCKIQLDITKEELFDDWNNGNDKYGLIKGEK